MDSLIEEIQKLVDILVAFVQKIKDKCIELYMSDSFKYIRALNFKFKHFHQILLISVLVFFFTFYFSGLNTTKVEAFNIQESVGTFNSEPYLMNYGHPKAFVNMAKKILSNKISVVSEAKTVKENSRSAIYEIDKYVVEAKLKGKKALGEVDAEFRVTAYNTYYGGDKQLAELYCADQNVEISEGVVCIYNVKIKLVDKDAPKIKLSTKDTTLSETSSFDPASYVESIKDNFDGDIFDYKVSGNDVGNDGDLVVGKHVITYSVKDSSGNKATSKLVVRVKEKAKPAKPTYTRVPTSPYAGSIVAEARRLIGSQYIYGANGPYAFDCSGLVQYVYKRAGIYVPRTSGTQAFYGSAIDPNDRSQWRAGDIITFGPAGSQHAAIYTGNGTMVHAINPSYGVLETSVYGDIYSVRRP